MPLTCHPSCKDEKTVYYWDAENAPIPFDIERDDLLKLFKSSLLRFGYNGVFQIKVFVGGYRKDHKHSRMSLQDKETMERHGVKLSYAESEKKNAADYELLKELKKDDRRSNYKNNVVIVGGDHIHVKYLQFCQNRHKRNNVMLLYTQELKKSVGNVLNKQLSLRDYLQLPPHSKQEKMQFDRSKRIATGKMESYLDRQRAKKGRKEQRRKAARNQNLEDEAEELQALGINEYVVLKKGCSKLLKEDGCKKNKNKKAKGFKEEKKHKMEEEMKRKGSCKGKRGREVVREEKKYKMEKDEEKDMKMKRKGKRRRGVVREENKQKMEEDEEENMKGKGKRGRGVVREEKKYKMEKDEEEDMKMKRKGKRRRGVVREENKQKMEEDEEENMKGKGKRGRGVVREAKKYKMEKDKEEDMKMKRKGKRRRGVVGEENKQKMEEDEEENMKGKGKRGRGVVREAKKQKKKST